jgi:hypothetical protein
MSSVRRTGSDHRATDAIVVGAGVVTAFVAYAPGVSTWLLSRGATCPLVRACGWQCPFCGMTRGTIALLHGDLGETLRMNPFALVYVLGLGWMIAKVLRPRRSRRDERFLGKFQWLPTAFLLGTFVALSLGRNLVT